MADDASASTAAVTPINRSPSRPQLVLSGAAIQGSTDDKSPSIVLPHQTDELCHFAVDVGGSLVKLVYFSRQADPPLVYSGSPPGKSIKERDRAKEAEGGRKNPILGGRLHFVKFETSKINECLDFIQSKRLHCTNLADSALFDPSVPGSGEGAIVKFLIVDIFPLSIICKATGGGAFKYAEVFKERLGVTFDKEDEMDCLVAGSNFLLRAIRYEAFTHLEGQKQFVQINHDELFPYLLVNIGSGVSIIKVDGDGVFQRVSGTNLGGGTFWGLGRLLMNCKTFDEILELSQRGDNSSVDMLVGDIYGGLDYSKIGLSASTIASSFGKAISGDKDLSDYNREDLALSLLRMISYNIGQIAYLNALQYGLKRIFFGGVFIRGHAYTMDTISFAINFWSKGEAQAMFLRHEGYLGALGAFVSYAEPDLTALRAHQFVERFPVGAPYAGGEMHGPSVEDLSEKISWIDRFMKRGSDITAPIPMAAPTTTGVGGFERPLSRAPCLRSDSSAALNVGVLHLVPTLEAFPLLADPSGYWFNILLSTLPDLVEKAVASEGATDSAKKRGDAFAQAFRAHLTRLSEDPAAYGKLGLANLLELREECLREFHFTDAYRAIKKGEAFTYGPDSYLVWTRARRENEAALAVLPDLLSELDTMTPSERILALIEGLLAANIFDWGSKACVELYRSGTIMEIYRMSRDKMKRPWRVDDFDLFRRRWIGEGNDKPHKRALLFVDNAGADIVLGVIPFVRELLRRGTEVVLVANSLPAVNDVVATEIPPIIAEAAKYCDVLRRSAVAGGLLTDAASLSKDRSQGNQDEPVPALYVVASGSGSPCIDLRQVSSEVAEAANGADLVVLEGMGRAVHTNFNAKFKCDVLKLAMIKNQRVADKLLNGSLYDCVCRYEPDQQV
ncbi:hypothetical protein R1sor_007821 [Riccia sorocarpa]|uniref:pantothenate kinase n=1 Tax=Riccia sorocarpa TaxID=122646 RepID=A0ABD3HRJ9_9MARC